MSVELEIMGLDPEDEQAWRALVGSPSLDAPRLAVLLGGSSERASRALERLAARGLATRRLDDRNTFVAARPSVALGGALAQRESDLRAAEAALARLDDEYNKVHHGRQPVELVDVVLGPSAVAAAVRQIQLGAREEVLSLVKAPVSVVRSADNSAEDVATSRGVTYRVVLEQAMFDEEPRLREELTRVRDRGEHVRVSLSVPTKLYVVDRDVALVPLGLTGAPVEGALLVHRSGLLEALVALFEATWSAAHELHPPRAQPDQQAEDMLEELDQRILTLLLAGFTDHSAASMLGVSSRTIQRRVRAMMEAGGVRTRLQLGRIAAERGWATATGPGERGSRSHRS